MYKALSKEQIEEFKEAFCLFDKDGDGYITFEELKDAMIALRSIVSDLELNKFLSELNTDGEGCIDFYEFLEIMTKDIDHNYFSRVIEMCKVFDMKGNGFISYSDFILVLKSIGKAFSEQEIEKIFNDSQIDGDGMIDYNEFIKMMQLV